MGKPAYQRKRYEGIGRGKSTMPNAVIVATVRCPWCGAAKGEPCHRHDEHEFGVQRGPECKPHPKRWSLYRRWLRAQNLTRPLVE